MNWAVIMAGGSGTRFWPLSNSSHPKQFLKLLGNTTPAASCLQRLMDVIPLERIWIVASVHHREALKKALPDFPIGQVLWEPVGRNTAACIAWVTELIRAQDPNAKIGVFPSDHDIPDQAAFAQCLVKAFEAAHHQIVLFGIEPTRPETGYGYIEIGENTSDSGIYPVVAFREKPDLETAMQYVKTKHHLWNSGMFIFDAETMHQELLRHVPQIVEKIMEIVNHPEHLDEVFPTIMSISIDYAVMEHTQNAVVLKASFPWDDLGTWAAIRSYYPIDEHGNAMHGDVRLVDSADNFIYAADGRRIAVLGLNHIIVVSTSDAILVMDDSRSQDVRKVSD